MDLKSLRSWAEQVPNELINLDKGERLMSCLRSQIADRESDFLKDLLSPVAILRGSASFDLPRI